MRVGRIEPLQHDGAHIGHVVAIGVFEEQNFRRAGDDHAAVPELEAERILHAGELGDAIRFAVVVVVVHDDQRVVHLLERFPLRIGRPDGGPQSTFGVELHLHGIDELRELDFIGEQTDFEALRDRHVLDALLRH